MSALETPEMTPRADMPNTNQEEGEEATRRDDNAKAQGCTPPDSSPLSQVSIKTEELDDSPNMDTANGGKTQAEIDAREERMAKAHERKRQAELDATIPRGRKPGRKKRGSSERELATQPPEKKPKGEKKSSRFYSPRYPNGHVKYRVG